MAGVKGLAYGILGEPFVALENPSIDTRSLEYGFLGSPFFAGATSGRQVTSLDITADVSITDETDTIVTAATSRSPAMTYIIAAG